MPISIKYTLSTLIVGNTSHKHLGTHVDTYWSTHLGYSINPAYTHKSRGPLLS